MEHALIRWNPAIQEWFCIKCGQTSDQISEQDARAELEKHDCQVPSQGTSSPSGTKTLRLIRKPEKRTPKAEDAVRDSVGMGAVTEEDKKK